MRLISNIASGRRPFGLQGASAPLGLAGGALVAAWLLQAMPPAGWGPLSHHMGVHILLMNVLAPLLALVFVRYMRSMIPALGTGRSLLAATLAQLVALWALHTPALLTWSAAGQFQHLAAQAILLATALWFWLAVAAQCGSARWRALAALLVTGKLFCLLAALLVFAPRMLYPDIVAGPGAHAAGLADQQFAGLLMVAVCPLTYVVVAIAISAQILRDLAGAPGHGARSS